MEQKRKSAFTPEEWDDIIAGFKMSIPHLSPVSPEEEERIRQRRARMTPEQLAEEAARIEEGWAKMQEWLAEMEK